MPKTSTQRYGLLGEFVEVDVRLNLQVEASEAHDDVVGEVLELNDPC